MISRAFLISSYSRGLGEPTKRDSNKNTSSHILIKITKDNNRDRILKAVKSKKDFTYKGTFLRFTIDLANGTLLA